MNANNRKEGIEKALSRSGTYGLLAQSLRCPDDDLWSTLHDRDRWVRWPELMGKIDFQTGEAISALQDLMFSPNPAAATSLDGVQVDFVRHFGHSVRGACPPYELEYGTSEVFQRTAELSDIKGFYCAFGLEIADTMHERPDHVAVEAEFMSVMAAKEAYAIEHAQEEGLKIVRDASARFLEFHLGRWLPSFGRRLREADRDGFYGTVGALACALIRFECEEAGVHAGADLLELRPTDREEETTQTCAVEEFGSSCSASSAAILDELSDFDKG